MDLDNRIKEHSDKKGKGSKYVRAFKSFKLVYSEKFESRSEAMRREAELKKWTKAQKEALVLASKSVL